MPTPKLTAALACTLLCTALFAQQKGTFTDTRDGKIYKTTKIGEQVWMAENLNYEEKGSRCYNDSTAYCKKYGRLYNWETVMKVCPSGWHLPSNAEWKVLFHYVVAGTSDTSSFYDRETADKFLKAAIDINNNSNDKDKYSSSGMKIIPFRRADKGVDKYGFSALPGGFRHSSGNFNSVGYGGYWWTTGEDNNYYECIYYYEEVTCWMDHGKSSLYSVRCVQNNK